MRGGLHIRRIKTSSGATGVQIVRNWGKKRIVVKHIGSAHNDGDLSVLLATAEAYAQEHRIQGELFAEPATPEAARNQNRPLPQAHP